MYTPTLSCLVQLGVTGNDVTVNNKGGATCNNNKKLLEGSSHVIKLIQITASEALDPVLDAPESANLILSGGKGSGDYDPILGSPKLIVERSMITYF